MIICLIKEGFSKKTIEELDRLKDLISSMEDIHRMICLENAMDIDDVNSYTYVIVRDIVAYRYQKTYSSSNSRGKLIVVFDNLDEFLKRTIIRLEAINSISLADLSAPALLYLIQSSRDVGELESYLETTKACDVHAIPNEDIKSLKNDVRGLDDRERDRFINVIGIYSPISTGKTTIATALAKSIANRKKDIVLIDTDCRKKDSIYYFDFDDGLFTRMCRLLRRLDNDEEIDINADIMPVDKHIYLASDHRDVSYTISAEQLGKLINSIGVENIIIDISSHYSRDEVNNILGLCSSRYLVLDSEIKTLNNIGGLLNLQGVNKNTYLIFNREPTKKIFSASQVKKLFGLDKHLRVIKSYRIPCCYEGIVRAMSKRSSLYGSNKDFTRAMDTITDDLLGGVSRKRRLMFRWKEG